MPRQIEPEITALAAAIVFGNKGRAQFSIGEAAQIAGWDKNKFGAALADAGVLVKPSGEGGNGKKVHAIALAEFMHKGRISPLLGRKGA